jgi:DNA-binding CsgD family transcriptional regulator
MPQSRIVSAVDIRAMFRLIGECRELGDDPITWRQHFYGQLAELIGADFAAGGEMAGCIGGRISTPGAALWGADHGFDLRGLMFVWEWNLTDPFISQIWSAFHPQLTSQSHPGVTAAHHQLMETRAWDRSPDYQLVMRTLGADAVIHSFHQLPEGGDNFEGICWFRAKGRPNFNEREVALVRLMHDEIVRLVGGPLSRFDEPAPSQLTLRVRQVLACVLEGDTDKQIAMRLTLSPFTVNDYTKQIYRHFRVTSRAELLARWIRRGWSGKAVWNLPADGLNLLIPY